jgi:hypothetical protein
MEQLVHAVGNAKICREFDWDDATAVDSEPNGEGPFQRLVDLNPGAGREKARDVVALAATSDVIRKFNRNSKRLATGILGAVVFVVLVLAVLIRARQPKGADLTGETSETRGDLLLSANPATLSKVVDLNGRNSTAEITSGQTTSVDQGFTVISPQENASPQTETPASTHALTSEIDHPNVQANASAWSLVHQQDSALVIGSKIHNIRHRSSVRSRLIDVKMRLIALWHQSLARSENSRIETEGSKLRPAP